MTFKSFHTLLTFAALLLSTSVRLMAQVDQNVIANTQPKLVKIYGSGGFANLHAYQTGVYYSSTGKIVTAWSHVLDGKVTIVDSSGQRRPATFVGMDPETEIAVLDSKETRESFFDLGKQTKLATEAKFTAGTKVVALSNLFGIATKNEQLSVMSGVVAGVSVLDGKLAQFKSPYRGKVIMVDLITNNPGAAGGVVVDHRGNLIGLVGKELKDRRTGIWLNFCLPVDAVAKSIQRIESGKSNNTKNSAKVPFPMQLADLGIELIPEIVETTRPYVDRAMQGSSARTSGIQPDDLILFVDGLPVRTIAELQAKLATIDRNQTVTLVIRRGKELSEVRLSRRGAKERGSND